MVLPFFVCQKWVQLAIEGKWLDRCTLVATTADGGDFGFSRGAEAAQGGALAGLLKAIFVEYAIMQDQKNLRVKVIDTAADTSPTALAGHVLRELASGTLDYEVAYVGGRRLVPAAVAREVAFARPANVRPGSTWIITGGARGITAACAVELGRRYGLRLHLIGSSPLNPVDPAWHELNAAGLQQLKSTVMIAARKAGKPFAAAWDRVQKDIEIDRSLRAYKTAGVPVTYHACDVSDRAALAETLARIRQQDGPIAGILHGAGVERSGRFEKKTREIAMQTISVKVDGAANLMALTHRDPVRHFIGFGSISGRLGGFGQADYSLANEMLAKLVGAYRRQRPWIQAVTFHWHAWDEIGMAARPETKEVLQSAGNLQLMPVGEGISHLLREVAAGAPEPEVMITEHHHWQRFSSGLAKMNEQAGAPVVEPAGAPSAAAAGCLPLLRNVQREPSGATLAEMPLDPQHDLFLALHRLRGKCLLPVVVGLEAFSEAAAVASGQQVIGVHNVDMIDGLMFHSPESATVQVRAVLAGPGSVECSLLGDVRSRAGALIQKDRLYLRGVAEVADRRPVLAAEIPGMSAQWTEFTYPDDAPMYHGPPFRGATAGCGNSSSGSARVVALPLVDLVGPQRVAQWTIPSVVLDSAMFSCGLHLWAFHGNLIGLPKSIGQLRLGRDPRSGEKCLVNFICREVAADRALYDFDVVGDDGAVIMQVRGYGKVVIGKGVIG
jgi:NAD(P)-dependent dehydrogenase (short-subunit alcohol dehydrogenase family)